MSVAITIAFGSALTVTDGSGGYTVTAMPTTVGARRRRSTVAAPDVHGVAETSSAIDEGRLAIAIRCSGGSWSGAEGLRNALTTASQQRSYALAVTIDGVTETWQARAADWESPITTELLLTHKRDVTLTIPVYPVPS